MIKMTFSILLLVLCNILAASENHIEAKLSIQEQIHRYATFYDANNLDALIQLFTEDATSELIQGNQHQFGSIDDLKLLTKQRMDEKIEFGITRRHSFTNTLIDIKGDTSASASSLVLITTIENNKITPFLNGIYHFTFEKSHSNWLIKHLTISSDVNFL